MSKAKKQTASARTTSKKTQAIFDYVLLRHSVAAKHGDLDRIEKMIADPFESGSSMVSAGIIPGKLPAERWMVAAQFKKESWVQLFSNAKTGEELFTENETGRRIEVVRMARDENGGLIFQHTRCRKPIVKFSAAEEGDAIELDCPDPDLQKTVILAQSAQKMFDVLCKSIGICLPLPIVQQGDKGFEVIGRRGKPVKTGMKAYKLYETGGVAKNDQSSLMEDAVAAMDPAAIQHAIDAGASPERLPDPYSSPLLRVLAQCGRHPNWKKCAEVLINGGCELEQGNNSMIIDCCSHFFEPENSIVILEFLVGHGADVDATDRNGLTALCQSAYWKRNSVVKALMDAGADPNIIMKREGVSLIESIRSRVEEEVASGMRSDFIETLSLLTGNPVEPPVVTPLSPELSAENTRFEQVRWAKNLLRTLPKKVEFRTLKVSRLANFKNYKSFVSELTRCGFVESCHFESKMGMRAFSSVYTDSFRNFDAVCTDGGSFGDRNLRLEIGAYLTNGTCKCVYNYPPDIDPKAPSRVFEIEFIENGSPEELVERLEQVTKGQEILSIDAGSFEQRYTGVVDRVLADLRKYGEDALGNQLKLPNGTLPRYERIGIYREIWDPDIYPDHSTATTSQQDWESLNKQFDPNDDYRWTSSIRDAISLLSLRHLEYAGAPGELDFLDIGADRVDGYFQLMRKKTAKFRDRWMVDVVAFSTVLAFLSNRTGVFESLCESLKTNYANPAMWSSGDPPVAVAQLQLLIASEFRKKAIRGSKAFPDEIRKSRSKHAKLLLEVWEAILAKDQIAFGEAITASLKHSVKAKRKKNPSGDLFQHAAWLESSLALIAIHRGLELPPLEPEFGDWLVTRESIM